MPIELKVPSVGESITEVQIGDWLVPEGQAVEKEGAVVVIETDKVTVELPAPAAGTVTRVLKKKGEKANVGEVIGYIENGPAQAKTPPKTKAAPAPAPEKAPTPAPAPAPAPAQEPRVMPSARRAIAEKGLEPKDVRASGPGGRILKEDVLVAPPAAKPAAAGAREEELVPMTPLRKRIAERLVQAQSTAALLTTFNEIDMSAVVALRKEHQEAFQKRYGIKLGFMSLFVKAVIDALKLVPQLNAELRGDNIAYRNYYDIGVAVGGGKGLVVPVLRDAERMSFAEIEVAIADLAKRAQENKLAIEELTGGTFTISNGGIYGSLLSTPIVNPPQSGIVGLHAIQDRPVARDGQVVIRPMMYVAVTYDHRLVDGREAVTFLKRIKECIEAPARMLLEA
ncbi:MAG TPA: 2-oxoglutarate dehydrogenase complex dihydrolipoyllysine-residue succinyltransferase [Planctomycetota bacterium]|jgi:2-oxoglutarate dehydrogenase E2 component (dihydrolipoamide succinyltransferase)|nr:2-oxoglutarate dehydrogenase complex dihydrolipoyllysine-residue succinyltransferase [Planctomycetota bacterium]